MPEQAIRMVSCKPLTSQMEQHQPTVRGNNGVVPSCIPIHSCSGISNYLECFLGFLEDDYSMTVENVILRKSLAPEQDRSMITTIHSGQPQGLQPLEQQQPYHVKTVKGTAVSPSSSAIPLLLSCSGVLSFQVALKSLRSSSPGNYQGRS